MSESRKKKINRHGDSMKGFGVVGVVGVSSSVVPTLISARSFLEYFGFDLFESFDVKAFDREFSITPLTKDQVGRFLTQKGVKKYCLFSGDTMESVPRVKAELPKKDLVFIDGAHTAEQA